MNTLPKRTGHHCGHLWLCDPKHACRSALIGQTTGVNESARDRQQATTHKAGHQNDVASTIHYLRHRMAGWRLRDLVKGSTLM